MKNTITTIHKSETLEVLVKNKRYFYYWEENENGCDAYITDEDGNNVSDDIEEKIKDIVYES